MSLLGYRDPKDMDPKLKEVYASGTINLSSKMEYELMQPLLVAILELRFMTILKN